MKRASSAASFSAISGPMWSRSNPPAASPAAASGHSSTTSPTRSAVFPSGITIRPNGALPSIWTLPTAASFSGVWRRQRTSFWKPSGRASWRPWGSITSLCANKTPRLIVCALTPFGQTGPWRDYLSSDLLHMAAGGEMASSGYDESRRAECAADRSWWRQCLAHGLSFRLHGHHGGSGLPDRYRARAVYRRVDPRGLCADDRGG